MVADEEQPRAASSAGWVSIQDLPLPEIELPPTDLPYDDGEKMESSWHADTQFILKASIIAARGPRERYYVANNMFVYYSLNQVKNLDYKGPDVFFVDDVDGMRYRDSWIAWVEDARLPDVIFELLSPSTEKQDLETKKQLYEQTFHTYEYFCIGHEMSRLFGWRLINHRYELIQPGANGRLWSEKLGIWIGGWRGSFLQGPELPWPRFFTPEGKLILLPDERAEEERQRADAAEASVTTERQRAEALAAQVATLEAELARLRGQV
jgi:Uma2 family endonuclease